MRNKFLVLASSLFLLFSVTSCNAFTPSGEENPPSEGGGEGGEVDPSLPANTKNNPYTIDQMIQAMKDLSVGSETDKDYYVKGKAVNVTFNHRWGSYSCYFEGHEENSDSPFYLSGGMLSVSEITNVQNVTISDLEGNEITFYGRAKYTMSGNKKKYSIGYFSDGSKKDPNIYKIEKDIPGMDDNWKTPGEGKVDIKQTYATYSGNNTNLTTFTPTKGDPKLLVIPLWFMESDSCILDSKKESVKSDIEKAFAGENEDIGWRSVKSYYEEESANQLKPHFYVQDFLDVEVSISFFNSVDHVTRNVENLINGFFLEHSKISRSDFDFNQDGYLDGVIFVCCCPLSEGWSSYCAWKEIEPNLVEPTSSMYMWTSLFTLYGSNCVEHTGVELESFVGGYTEHCELDTTTFIHEMGHMLGLVDYYDYSCSCSPAGHNTMQDFQVGSHDAFSVMAYGWADPYIPSESCTIEIGAFQSTKEMILLTPHWNKQDSAFDEYLLLELYTPTGLNEFHSQHERFGDTTPTSVGIRLWHVDARLTANINHTYCSNLITDAENPYLYSLAMTNTYYASGMEGRLSPLGPNYYDYKLLQYIRNDEEIDYMPRGKDNYINNDNLFKDGDTFDMNTFGAQFKNTGKLNSGEDLGWSFVVSISGEGANARASVVLTKA